MTASIRLAAYNPAERAESNTRIFITCLLQRPSSVRRPAILTATEVWPKPVPEEAGGQRQPHGSVSRSSIPRFLAGRDSASPLCAHHHLALNGVDSDALARQAR